MSTFRTWQQQIGHQRDWAWRGWQIRYTFMRGQQETTQPPMLLLHGFGASIGHWRFNIPVFAQDRTVYALDLLGFGASEKVSTDYLVTLWVEQVHDFWQTYIRTPMVLVGNSLGSLVSLTAAALYPEMVAGLAMLTLPDTSVLKNPSWVKPAIAPLKLALNPIAAFAKALFTAPPIFNPFFQFIRQPKIIRSWVRKAYIDTTSVEDDLVDILSSPAYDQGAADALRAMVNTMSKPQVPQHSAKEMLPQLTIPILLVWGQQDVMIPPKLGPLFARCNPRIQLVELAHAGHCPHDECPDRLNPILIDWLAAHFPIQQPQPEQLHCA
ncbi:alpha/beta fold hydrolase [Acaryochloris sp. CCMEE 5410]|uniref:alpha/beta fold hydrolase n=1 Tax=Acaryochloris sp. CCMEE 5410 TaxID=310037 RepID=UPI000248464F|nr:alpha/beta fold hydrolase [Acaryochloris sp. CCMEE 5410]KAI9131763.1 alpha/beta fold hydrolase [Acaryochloris sp. CCMEE 5410]